MADVCHVGGRVLILSILTPPRPAQQSSMRGRKFARAYMMSGVHSPNGDALGSFDISQGNAAELPNTVLHSQMLEVEASRCRRGYGELVSARPWRCLLR